MMMIRSAILTVILTLSCPAIFGDDSCRFQDPDRGVIDLTTLGRADGHAAYADRIPPAGSNYKYSYNPCEPFSEEPGCQNVSVCQAAIDGRYSFTLGTQESTSWNPGALGANPSVTYSYGEKRVIVALKCSSTEAGEFEVFGEDPVNVYTFRLTHRCACWNGCSSTPSSTTATTTTAPPSPPCRFEYPGKGVIDFSFIGRTDEKAAYTDEMTQAALNFKYSYNPCRSFSEGTACIGVSVCQISNDGQHTFTLGTQESASWNPGSSADSTPSVNYSYAEKKVTVLLQCSPEGNNEFQAFGENPTNNYRFRLTHKCAYWNGCSSIPSTMTTSNFSNHG